MRKKYPKYHKPLTKKQKWGAGIAAGAVVVAGIGFAGLAGDLNGSPTTPDVFETLSESPLPSETTKSATPKAKKTPKKTSKPSPTSTERYDGDPAPSTTAPKPGNTASGGLEALVEKLKNGDENNDGYEREKFGSRAPTAATREALIEQEMRPNNTWYSLWDGFLYEGTDGLDADHTVALGEAWGSGARDWTEARRIEFANDLTSPYTLNLISADLNRLEKSDKDPFDWMPKANQCEYVKQWTTVKLRWGLTADGEEKMALHFRAEECDKV